MTCKPTTSNLWRNCQLSPGHGPSKPAVDTPSLPQLSNSHHASCTIPLATPGFQPVIAVHGPCFVLLIHNPLAPSLLNDSACLPCTAFSRRLTEEISQVKLLRMNRHTIVNWRLAMAWASLLLTPPCPLTSMLSPKKVIALAKFSSEKGGSKNKRFEFLDQH